jgi:hypothetical protein
VRWEERPLPGHMGTVVNRRGVLKSAAKIVATGAVMTLLPAARAPAEDTKGRPPLKYAICNEMFAEWPLEKAFRCIADCGYQAVEIAPFTIATYVTSISDNVCNHAHIEGQPLD